LSNILFHRAGIFKIIMIAQKLLLNRGATLRNYKKNQSIFFEGDMPCCYYQIVQGSVKMVSVNEGGREFIQGIFRNGQSFGEPVLLINKPYPATAVANENTQVLKIGKEEFLKILNDFPQIHFEFTCSMAQRIYEKALIAKAISINGPEQRIIALFKILKESNDNSCLENYKVTISRQQIADMIGFRVETAIRTIKTLEKKGVIKIQKGKIYLLPEIQYMRS
jgi:CRP-like cAMP-binding protein